MSKLIFDDHSYILKRNPYANWLFIIIVIYSIISFYIYYPRILEIYSKLDLLTLIIYLIFVIVFDLSLILLILLSYFFSIYFEFDSISNQLIIYRYFIWWKYKFTSIDLKQFKDLYVQQVYPTKKLFLDPRDEQKNKDYLTSVNYKLFETSVWKSFITDLKRNFVTML